MQRVVDSCFVMLIAAWLGGGCVYQIMNADAAIDLPASTASAQCDNPDCTCENCECDPCECKEDTRNWLYVFTTDNCVPCIQMKQTELPQLKAAGHRVIFMPESDPKFAKYYKFYQPSGGFPLVIEVNHEGMEVRRFEPGKVTVEQVEGRSVLESVPVGQVTADTLRERTYYQPKRTGWFRGRSVRACGPGGCN